MKSLTNQAGSGDKTTCYRNSGEIAKFHRKIIYTMHVNYKTDNMKIFSFVLFEDCGGVEFDLK